MSALTIPLYSVLQIVNCLNQIMGKPSVLFHSFLDLNNINYFFQNIMGDSYKYGNYHKAYESCDC